MLDQEPGERGLGGAVVADRARGRGLHATEAIERTRRRGIGGIVPYHSLVGEEGFAGLAPLGQLVGVGHHARGGCGAARAELDGRRSGPGGGAARQQEQRGQGAERSAHAAALLRGSSIVKQLPTPGVESTDTVPLWASTTPFTTASPRPLP